MSSDAPQHPFRVTRSADRSGPPLTEPQKQVLAALVALCPTSGSDCDARAVAGSSGLRLGAVVVILQSLVVKRLVTRFEEDDDALFWTPSMTGRARVRHFQAVAGDRVAEPPKPNPA